MANNQSNAVVTWEPVYVDPNLIIVPLNPQGPGEDPDPDDYNDLDPYVPDEYDEFDRLANPERDLLINIETSGLKPYESRIISIAWLDTTAQFPEIKVMTSKNEKELIDEFFNMFDNGNFTRLVGWNLSFDYRFLWGIAALYRRQVTKWAKIKLRDVQQIYQQVKEEFVYGFQKPDKMESWARFLFGTEKLFPQEEVLKRFIKGNFEAVDAFNLNQVRMLRDLYDLARFTSGEGFLRAQNPVLSPTTPITQNNPNLNAQNPKNKQCRNCLAFNAITNKECIVCGNKF